MVRLIGVLLLIFLAFSWSIFIIFIKKLESYFFYILILAPPIYIFYFLTREPSFFQHFLPFTLTSLLPLPLEVCAIITASNANLVLSNKSSSSCFLRSLHQPLWFSHFSPVLRYCFPMQSSLLLLFNNYHNFIELYHPFLYAYNHILNLIKNFKNKKIKNLIII